MGVTCGLSYGQVNLAPGYVYDTTEQGEPNGFLPCSLMSGSYLYSSWVSPPLTCVSVQ